MGYILILILDKPGNKSPGKINDPYFMLNVVCYIIKHFVLTLKPWKSVEFGMLLELKIEISFDRICKLRLQKVIIAKSEKRYVLCILNVDN